MNVKSTSKKTSAESSEKLSNTFSVLLQAANSQLLDHVYISRELLSELKSLVSTKDELALFGKLLCDAIIDVVQCLAYRDVKGLQDYRKLLIAYLDWVKCAVRFKWVAYD